MKGVKPNCRLRWCRGMSKNCALRVSYIAALAKLGVLMACCQDARLRRRALHLRALRPS